jgi:hypothetical protein
VETINDTIELINNKYVHKQKILEDGANFQAIGGVAGNWHYSIPNTNFQMDFATLGIDPKFELNVQSLARIIIDDKIYSNDLANSYRFIFNPGSSLDSGNPGILLRDEDFVTEAAFAAFIAAATTVVFDFYMVEDDWEERVIIPTGFTVIEENGTIIEENDDGIAFVAETEIPVNIPAAIKENTFDIRRLFNLKNEYVVLEDFRLDPLDITSSGTPGTLVTDKMSAEYSSYIVVYTLPSIITNENLGLLKYEFYNPYFTNPGSLLDKDFRVKLGRVREPTAGGDIFRDYEFNTYFLVAKPNQLGIGNGGQYVDTKKPAATNVYSGRSAVTTIDVVALLGVKSNEQTHL